MIRHAGFILGESKRRARTGPVYGSTLLVNERDRKSVAAPCARCGTLTYTESCLACAYAATPAELAAFAAEVEERGPGGVVPTPCPSCGAEVTYRHSRVTVDDALWHAGCWKHHRLARCA